MASSMSLLALFIAVAVGVHGAPLQSLTSGADDVAAVEKRYEAVETKAGALQQELLAAVQAGRLSFADITAVNANLQGDALRASAINTKLYQAVSNCWMFISVPGGLDMCQKGAAASVLGDVVQLESAFFAHSAAAQEVLNSGPQPSGADMVDALMKRYGAVKDNAGALKQQLVAAVEAGRLSGDDTSGVQGDLDSDLLQVSAISSKLATNVNSCWAFLNDMSQLNACHIRAAQAITDDVIQVEASFSRHDAAAQELLNR